MVGELMFVVAAVHTLVSCSSAVHRAPVDALLSHTLGTAKHFKQSANLERAHKVWHAYAWTVCSTWQRGA